MPSEPMDLLFPIRGLNENWAYNKQPDGTTPDCENVIPFDSIDSRARGGQRWGTSKYYSSQHNGSETLQRMSSIAQSIEDVGSVAISETFTQADGVLSDTDWYPCVQGPAGGDWNLSAVHPYVSGNKIVYDNVTAPGVKVDIGAWHKSIKLLNLTSRYEASAKITMVKGTTVNGSTGITFDFFAAEPTFPDWDPSYTGEVYAGIKINSTGGVLSFTTRACGAASSGVIASTPGSGDWLDPAYWTTPRTVKIIVENGYGRLYVDDVLVDGPDGSSPSDTPPFGGLWLGWTVLKSLDTADSTTFDTYAFSTGSSSSGREYKIVAISGGDVFYGTPSGSLSAATSGTNAVNISGRVDMQPAYTKIYFADDDPAHYKYFDNSNNTIYTWTPTAGTLPMGSEATAVNITAATPATPSFTVAEDWSGRAAGDYLLVAGSTANDGYYTIASTAGAGPTVITVNETVADNTADGTIQYQDNACKINCLYRGRIVMAGLLTDPHNWFMSAAGDPLDWDYGATVSATMAVAGNNTDAGYCPDIITCLAPYSDDLLFIGGDHSLWLMRGDPADRGRIDNISYQTGISGPDAYTFDPNGIFYFFGSGTVWRMAAGGVPEPLSRNRMDQTFSSIDLTTNTVHLAWDNVRHGLFIFIVPNKEGATTHYFWDERTDSFWKMAFPNTQGPTTIYAFDGDNPDDNALLLGGWGGYIRYIDSAAKNDDGTAISSYVLYSPISPGGILKNARVSQITTILDTNSDDVVLAAYAEDTVQKVIESSTIRFAKTISAGRTKFLNRIAGNAIMFKLSNSVSGKTWAIESMNANVEITGNTRKNQL